MDLLVETIVHQTGQFGAIILFAISVFLIAEFLFLSWSARRRRLGIINSRLHIANQAQDIQSTVIELRKRRGLTSDGRFQLPLTALNRLIMQSGVSLSAIRVFILMALSWFCVATVVYVFTSSAYLSIFVGFLAGLFLPIIVLIIYRKKRIKLFERQLPEAIDTMVRSLKAGHPLGVAISMVAREMADPVGSEFGMVADEMTYGLDLESAMANMSSRSGHSDLSFLVVATSIQLKTGGNLAEILANLSNMIRAREKMRRKVHSLSAAGRFSAIALSILPCALYLSIRTTTPQFFEEVKYDPLLMQAFYFGLCQWIMGIYVLRRMVNFKV